MLILTRKKDEGIIVKGRDGEIRIIISEIKQNKVRIGIEASEKAYLIIREELPREVASSNISAGSETEDIVKRLGGRK
jgi:carbon storage regulator CsrA